ncbi:hypothetical protein ABEB36_007919 [Hypothenemus hampei]
MGKNQRHKKDLKADKAKVKLKQTKTKFLPKGLNVTKTEFKIKPIVLPEQLKQKGPDEILSRRKLNIKDLLSRIKHYNENMRYSACEELSDMIKIHTQEIIEQHLAQISLAVSGLMQDKERKVRKAAVKAIKTILEHISEEFLNPFFNYFSTNLRCSMTNIDWNIQEDSLQFLDCFINHQSKLIVKNSEKLLPDFLSLISKMRNDSEIGRTLTLNLGSKMTSVSWKIKVLSRLHDILNIILHVNKQENENRQEKVIESSIGYKGGLFKSNFNQVLDNCNFDIFGISKIADNGVHGINRHIKTLIPLLYETWLEVVPEQKGHKSTSESYILSEEMAALLTCITKTLHLLYCYVKTVHNEEINLNTVFMSTEGQKFLNHLLGNVPYGHSGLGGKKWKALGITQWNNDPKCVHENLLICFLYLTLHVNCTQRNFKKQASLIDNYLTKVLLQKYFLKEDNCECLLELFTESLVHNPRKWFQSGVDLQATLEHSITLYDGNKIANEQQRLKCFHILSSFINNERFNRNPSYQRWLRNLPNEFNKKRIAEPMIGAMLRLSQRNCREFQGALLEKLPSVLENLNSIQVTFTSNSVLNNEDVALRTLAAIFYYLPYTKDQNVVLKQFLDNSQSKFKTSLKQVLDLR